MNCNTPGLPVHHQLPGFTQTHVWWVGDVIQPSHPLSSLSPPALNLSQHQGLFQWVFFLHRWPKYWNFSFNISPCNEHPGLISFRMDWLDLLAVQGTLKCLLQYHSSKASILWCTTFFIVQLSHLYMTIGRIIALTRWTFVGKVTSLPFNMLSKLVFSKFSNFSYKEKASFFLSFFNFYFIYFILFFNFTILYWFCHISKWIWHRYTCIPHPEPSSLPYHPSGLSQCTSPKHPVSCIEPGLATCFIYDIIHVSMPFSQIFPPSPSPTESIRLFYSSVSLLLSHIQGYCYHLSKFHIYALV